MAVVSEESWLRYEQQFAPGAELYRSERHFKLWAYSVSHNQLLFRSRGPDDSTRVDILFEPVIRLSLRTGYSGLAIRCATEDEREIILADVGDAGRGSRVLMLESGMLRDFVVTGAFGWREDDGDYGDPSGLGSFPPGTDPQRILP